MRVMCIKQMSVSKRELNSIKVGDWIEVYEKSIYDMTNDNSATYFYNPPGPKHIEYAFYKSNFITLEQWRENQLNQLGI